MAKLTQAFVKRVECEEGKTKQEFYDESIKGFLLEVRNCEKRGQALNVNFSYLFLKFLKTLLFIKESLKVLEIEGFRFHDRSSLSLESLK